MTDHIDQQLHNQRQDELSRLRSERSLLRENLAEMLSFARRNWPDDLPGFETMPAVLDAKVALERTE